MTQSHILFYEPAQVLDDDAWDVSSLAQHCAVPVQWVIDHVSFGVLEHAQPTAPSSSPLDNMQGTHHDPSPTVPDSMSPEAMPGTASKAKAPETLQWRFSSRSVVRARRMADLERHFDADPQLAAMTADLIEEVQLLRKRLAALGR